MKRPLAVLLAIALLAAAGAAAFAYRRWGPLPDTAEAVGPFEIVTHYSRYIYGYNEGRLRQGVTEHYSLRWKGEPFTFEGRGTSFRDTVMDYRAVNAVITFPSPEPAVVVNAGDPNNTSHYYLVREVDGRPRAEYLGPSSGNVAADWIDPAEGDAARPRELAVHRKHLRGGRWLLLGEETVLDTRTLRAFPAKHGPDAYPSQHRTALGTSPDEHSFVRLASSLEPSQAPMLVVNDFVSDTSYALPIDRRTMRYVDLEEIDAAWVAHHFEWTRTAGGHDRLRPRADAATLPHHGRLSVQEHDGARSYHLAPVKPEMRDTLAAFIERELGATRVRSPYPDTETLSLRGEMIHLMYHAADLPGDDSTLGVSMDITHDTAPVAEIARRFDAALRTGRHDALFLP